MEECVGGFALGFLGGRGLGGLAELGQEAGFGEGWGFEVEQGLAGGVDAGDGLQDAGVSLRLEDLCELIEVQVVVVGDVDGAAVGVEQVPEEGVEAGRVEDGIGLGCRCARRVDHHAGIVACRRCGTRAAWRSAGILRTKGEIGGRFLNAAGAEKRVLRCPPSLFESKEGTGKAKNVASNNLGMKILSARPSEAVL